MTLACEDGNSKLVEVVTVANFDDEDRVGNSLLQIWELRFGHKGKLLFTMFAGWGWAVRGLPGGAGQPVFPWGQQYVGWGT